MACDQCGNCGGDNSDSSDYSDRHGQWERPDPSARSIGARRAIADARATVVAGLEDGGGAGGVASPHDLLLAAAQNCLDVSGALATAAGNATYAAARCVNPSDRMALGDARGDAMRALAAIDGDEDARTLALAAATIHAALDDIEAAATVIDKKDSIADSPLAALPDLEQQGPAGAQAPAPPPPPPPTERGPPQ